MLNNITASFWQDNKRSIISLFLFLFMVLTFAILIYFTVAQCAANCEYHGSFSDSCIGDGSLYCCRSATGVFSQFSCGAYQECELDNDHCGRLVLGSEIFAALTIIALAAILFQALRLSKRKNYDSGSSPARNMLAEHMITSSDESDTTTSARSSTDRENSCKRDSNI